MINFWKLAYKSVKEQRDQHKIELQQCKSERHHYKAELESYKTNLKQRKEALEYTRDEVKKYKTERDTLIDDLSWYKAKVSRLERENRFLLSRKDNLFDSWRDENKRSVALSKRLEQLEREIKEFDKDYEVVTNNCIYWEDKAHWLEDESSKYINLLSEISQHIGNKPSSSTYKYFRAKLDGIGIKEDE